MRVAVTAASVLWSLAMAAACLKGCPVSWSQAAWYAVRAHVVEEPGDAVRDPLAQRPVHRSDLVGERQHHHPPHDLQIELALGAEVVVDQPARHAGLARQLDGGDLGVRLLAEEPDGTLEDLLPPYVGLEPPPGRGGRTGRRHVGIVPARPRAT
jgi:hypothetical protein